MIQYDIPNTDAAIRQRLTDLMAQAEQASTRREIKAILSEWSYLNTILQHEF